MEIDFNDFDVQDDVIKTGNGNGGYKYCNKKNCPLKNND